MTRSKLVLGACAITMALAAGVGWTAQADTADARQDAQPASARAIAGYQLVRLDNANVGNFQRRTVNCPNGKRALGGGAEARGNNSVLNGSFPSDDGRGWIGVGHQPGENSVGISVFVICADA
ncbi:hypothetical protein ACFWIQ_36805 [Kitasatospora sp. NPDC127059]|uniref:hypothetical protein n=1 Tax=unclassified Kitasatospora TaxID=2633591 RepID=UPI003668A097